MKKTDDEIVKEILDKCNKKKIRVHFILKVNKKELGMDYFIAPPIEDVGGINFGARHGYSYNTLFKTLKKDSIGSGDLFRGDNFEEIYRDEQ